MDIQWTDEQIALLKQLWADKTLSGSDIGKRFGASRNAILGKVHRLGLPAREHTKKGGRPKRKQEGRTATVNGLVQVKRIKNAKADMRLVVSTEPVAPKSPLSADDIPLAQRKQLLELGPSDCRFPYGEVGHADFFFCGAVCNDGLSYCPDHCRIVYNASPPAKVYIPARKAAA